MAIARQQAQGVLLDAAMQKYVETRVPTTHMQGFFPSKVYGTTNIPLSVKRRKDLAATDVLRGTNGKLIQGTLESIKDIVPPMYHPKINVNSLRAYERAFGLSTTAPMAAHAAMLSEEIADELMEAKNMIIRAQEIQATEVLEDGTVTLKNGDIIDYARQAGSKVDNSADSWNAATAQIEKQLVAGCEFVRQEAGIVTGLYDLTISQSAWIALKKSNYFKDTANYTQVTLLDINTPQNRAGASFHGRITAGSFVLNVWTYDQTYENAAGTRVRYSNELKAIITPSEGFIAEMAYGAIDQRYKSSGAQAQSVQLVRGPKDFYVWDHVDYESLNWNIHMTSAPIARLISVDAVYTMKVAVDWTNPAIG